MAAMIAGAGDGTVTFDEIGRDVVVQERATGFRRRLLGLLGPAYKVVHFLIISGWNTHAVFFMKRYGFKWYLTLP